MKIEPNKNIILISVSLIILIVIGLTISYTLREVSNQQSTNDSREENNVDDDEKPEIPEFYEFSSKDFKYSLKIKGQIKLSDGMEYYVLTEQEKNTTQFQNSKRPILDRIYVSLYDSNNNGNTRSMFTVSKRPNEYANLSLMSYLEKVNNQTNEEIISIHEFKSDHQEANILGYNAVIETNYRNGIVEFKQYYIEKGGFIYEINNLSSDTKGHVLSDEDIRSIFYYIELGK